MLSCDPNTVGNIRERLLPKRMKCRKLKALPHSLECNTLKAPKLARVEAKIENPEPNLMVFRTLTPEENCIDWRTDIEAPHLAGAYKLAVWPHRANLSRTESVEPRSVAWTTEMLLPNRCASKILHPLPKRTAARQDKVDPRAN
jgi:hypothetical protein